jgi:hypothetical protein
MMSLAYGNLYRHSNFDNLLYGKLIAIVVTILFQA